MSFFMSLFGGGKSVPQAPAYTPPPDPATKAAELEAAAKKARAQRQSTYGKSSTMVTGGMGVIEEAPVAKKQLTGQ